jgi:hypothetical protein
VVWEGGSCEAPPYPDSAIEENSVKDPRKRISLDVAVYPGSIHSWEPGPLLWALSEELSVRSLDGIDDLKTIERLCADSRVNTVFPMPYGDWQKDFEEFIIRVREKWPRVIFVLYMDQDTFQQFSKRNRRFGHYLILSPAWIQDEFEAVIRSCEDWHWKQFEFDACISFAGQDRQYAEQIVRMLQAEGLTVFYDADEQSRLLGRELGSYLHEVYSKKSRYCLPLISEAYRDKYWTVFERRASLERAIQERGAEYILPVRIDETEIPGILSTVGYVHIQEGPEKIARLVAEKIGLYGYKRKERLA